MSLTGLFNITFEIILPIFIIIALAALLERRIEIDTRSLARLIIYLFTPCLVFHRMSTTDLSAGEAGSLIMIMMVLAVIMALLAWGVARLAGFDTRLESSFMLSSVLINAGNYGLPLNEFAFGPDGEARAVLCFVGSVVMSNTLGIFLASRGEVSTRRALLNVLTVPLAYAVLLGLLVNLSHITVPVPIERSTGLLGQAANPAMLTVLGMQLSRARLYKDQIRPILMVSGLRLVVAPLVMVGLTVVFGLSGLTRNVAIVQAAMPTAVISSVLAAEFGADTQFAMASILTSTLISIVTLSVVLSLVL
ncbi:MAG: AEC family transporter [Anaerolineae bacterium]|nr:AEC family transporter [Anaerolineae bacterium]